MNLLHASQQVLASLSRAPEEPAPRPVALWPRTSFSRLRDVSALACLAVALFACSSECDLRYRNFPSGNVEIASSQSRIALVAPDEVELKRVLTYNYEFQVERQDIILRSTLFEDGLVLAKFEPQLISAGESVGCGQLESDTVQGLSFADSQRSRLEFAYAPQSQHVLLIELVYSLGSQYSAASEEDRILDRAEHAVKIMAE